MTNLRDDARWLVDQVAEAKAMAKALGKPQLGTSSIESGKIEEYDSEGTLTQIIGEQYDGTHIAVSVSGPTPPEPLAATVTVGFGSVELRWNGKFAEGAMSPMDFSHVSAHGSRLAVFSPDNTTKLADIAGESGDVATVLLEPGEWTIGLVAVSKSGKWSEMSETITVEILDFPSPVDIQQELIDLDVKMDGAITEAGSLGTRLEQAETDLVASGQRLTQAELTLTPLPGKIAAAETKINTDIPVAIKAADDAAKMALLIAPVSTAAPALADGEGRPIGAIWTRIDGSGNEIGYWRWTASGWIIQALSTTVIPNLSASKITSGQIDVARLNAQAVAAAVGTFLELNASQITAGEILTARLNAQEIAAATAAFQTVDVKNLFATTGTMTEAVINKLWTDVVMSRKITTQMLAVGSFDNIIPDPTFTNAGGTWEPMDAAYSIDAAGGRGGTTALKITRSTAAQLGKYTPYMPAVPGATYKLTAWVKASASVPVSAVSIYARVQRISNGAVSIANTGRNAEVIPADTWAKIESTYTVIDDAKTMAFGVFSQASLPAGVHLWVDSFSSTRMNDGELIVDGAVKAAKIDTADLAANTGFIADLTARIVKSDMFVGKEFIGGVFTGAVFQSPGGGAGFQLTESGYTSRDEAGNVTVRLPADGSPAQFKGDIEAQSLTVSGRASLQAPENEITSGATLVLEAGVTPPLTPPTVGTTYMTVPLAPLPSGESAIGLAYAQGMWWRGVRRTANNLGRIEGLGTNGVIKVSKEIVEDPINGLTAIGNTLYLLGTRNARPVGERWVVAYNVTTTAVTWSHFWQYTDYGTGTYQPGIGVNGSDVMIGQTRINGPFTWRTYNSTTGALVSQIDSTFVRRDDVVGIVQTAGDFGATRIVVAFKAAVTESFTTAGVNTGPSKSWYSAGRAPNLGIVWQGGAFWQHAAQQGVVKYSGIKDPTGTGDRDTDDWWIAATWRGAGGVETTTGPPQRFTFMRRSELQLAAGTLPAGVTGVRFYLGRKVTAPTRTDMHLLATVTGAKARVATLPANWASLANPPAANTFSATNPGEIRSRADNFQVSGDGSGKWGPLVFHPDGTMTSSAVPAWVPITSFLGGCAVGDFGYVPAYRSWPDGKVELRGVVKGTLDVFKSIFALPAAMRSAQAVNLVAATSAGGGGPAVMRVELGGAGIPDNMTIQPQGITRSWLSLDGLYYYQV